MTVSGGAPGPDRGTGLGRLARGLARTLSALLRGARAVPRAVRAVAGRLGAWAVHVHRRLRRVRDAVVDWARGHRRALTIAAGAIAVSAVIGATAIVPGAASASATVGVVGAGLVAGGAVLAGTAWLLTRLGPKLADLLRRPARWLAGVISRIGTAIAEVAAAIARVATAIAEIAAAVGRAIGAVLRAVAASVRRAFEYVGALVLRPLRAIGNALSSALRAVVRAVARAARAIADACTRIAAAFGRAVRPLLHWVARVAARSWIAVVIVGRRVARSVAATVGHAARAVGRALGRVSRSIGRVLGTAFAAIGRLVVPLARAIGRVLRRATNAVGLVGARLARLVARAASRLLRPLAAFGRTVGGVVQRFVGTIGRWLTSVALVARHFGWRVAHAVGVAVVKARYEQRSDDDAAVREAARARAVDRVVHASSMPFHVEVDQNEYLYRGGREVHAIVSVDADGTRVTAEPEAAVVLLLDCSGSMGHPWSKLRRAREAAAASIDALRDGAWFAVVRGTESADVLYPPDGMLVPATAETRVAAQDALRLLWPEGGTSMGTWLRLARQLVDARPAAIANAILLTDGCDESETRADLDAALRECTGRVQCDCRGVGTDWAVEELRTIASRTAGSVDIVADPADLLMDFRAMTEAAMAKRVGDVRLRLWTPKGASIRFVKQVAPDVVDLTRMRRRVDDRTVEFPTGAWGTESRDFHVCIEVAPRAVGEEVLAARVTLEVGAVSVSRSLVRAVWTDDEERATRITPRVAHATGQAELVDHVRRGLEARTEGDDDTATFHLGRAVAIATATHNEDTVRLLRTVVDVDDADRGTVRLRKGATIVDEMALDARSSRTTRLDGRVLAPANDSVAVDT